MNLLPFFGRYSHLKFRFFSKMSIFLKFSNCCIIIAQTTYFENIQYCKIYFHYGLGPAKLEDIFISNFDFFKKCLFFLKFSNCRIIIAQTTYFETSNIVKNTFTMIQVWLKLVTMTLLPFFGRYSHFKFRFFQKCPFSQSF